MSRDDSPRNEHYFTEDPSRVRRTTSVPLRVRGTNLTLEMATGVFSSTGIDRGTAVLLHHLEESPPPPLPDGSTIADVGCGAGPIALALAVIYPACTVLAVDVNRAALELCRSNAIANHLDNVRCVHPDDLEPGTSVQMVVSNPPIRIGKENLHELLQAWLSRLVDRGVAYLVVGKNLGADSLARWMEQDGHEVERLASRKGFRVLRIAPVPRGIDQ